MHIYTCVTSNVLKSQTEYQTGEASGSDYLQLIHRKEKDKRQMKHSKDQNQRHGYIVSIFSGPNAGSTPVFKTLVTGPVCTHSIYLQLASYEDGKRKVALQDLVNLPVFISCMLPSMSSHHRS